MRQICYSIVGALGSWWGYIGWALFLATVFLPAFIYANPDALAIWLTVASLMLVWWLIDVVDQGTALWMVLVGVVMLGIGGLPRGRIMPIACWVIYWTRVRE